MDDISLLANKKLSYLSQGCELRIMLGHLEVLEFIQGHSLTKIMATTQAEVEVEKEGRNDSDKKDGSTFVHLGEADGNAETLCVENAGRTVVVEAITLQQTSVSQFPTESVYGPDESNDDEIDTLFDAVELRLVRVQSHHGVAHLVSTEASIFASSESAYKLGEFDIAQVSTAHYGAFSETIAEIFDEFEDYRENADIVLSGKS